MTIKDVYILIPGTHENVRLHVNGKLGLQVELGCYRSPPKEVTRTWEIGMEKTPQSPQKETTLPAL